MTFLSTAALTDRVRTLADETAEGSDVFVLDVVMKGGNGGPNLEVSVDTDAGVTVDQLSAFSRELGFALDTADLIDGHYELTVSSPGATKPLALPRQYPRHVGKPLEVKLREPLAEPDGLVGATALTGALTAVDLDAGTLALSIPGKTKKDAPVAVVVPLDAVVEARVKLPW